MTGQYRKQRGQQRRLSRISGRQCSHHQRDLVLIIEHLEAMPTDLVQALLTSLRAAFMDQQTRRLRVMVVVSGALSLATLTVGESSPFRGSPAACLSEICRRAKAQR